MERDKNFILGVYDDEDVLLDAISKVRGSGVKIHEVYSPFPVHGIDDVLGYKRSKLPIAAFLFGMLGTTFGGNPLACAAALAVLEVMEKENLMEAASQKGKYLIEALKNTKGVKVVRGKGLMIGFEMETGLEDIRKVLLNDYKIFTGEAKPNVIRLLPSLSISNSAIELFLKGLKEATAQILNKTV